MKMKNKTGKGVSRRKFVRLAAAVTPALALAACGEQSATVSQAQPTTAAPTTAAPTTAAKAIPTAAAPATTQATTQAAQTTTAAAVTTQATTAPATTQATTAAAQVAQILAPTPSCTSKASQTIAQTEGPYFKPSSPERASLIEAGTTGTRLILTGYVLTTDCKPVKGALLDFWQADANGQYDNQGFKMRGHQYTNEAGLFRLETVVPGLYPGRTRHIHVKVQAPNQPVLTTQLYFPGEARNQSDSIFRQELLMQMQDGANGGRQGIYNFVLKTV